MKYCCSEWRWEFRNFVYPLMGRKLLQHTQAPHKAKQTKQTQKTLNFEIIINLQQVAKLIQRGPVYLTSFLQLALLQKIFGITIWMYFIPLNCILKNSSNNKFIFYTFITRQNYKLKNLFDPLLKISPRLIQLQNSMMI